MWLLARRRNGPGDDSDNVYDARPMVAGGSWSRWERAVSAREGAAAAGEWRAAAEGGEGRCRCRLEREGKWECRAI